MKQKSKFERLEVEKDVARDMFSENPFKLELIDRIPDATVSLYKCGDFIDLCRGPHVGSTGVFAAINLFRCSGSHWDGGYSSETQNKLLQRVYGIAFPSKAEMKEWQERVELARQRDHRYGKHSYSIFAHTFKSTRNAAINRGLNVPHASCVKPQSGVRHDDSGRYVRTD